MNYLKICCFSFLNIFYLSNLCSQDKVYLSQSRSGTSITAPTISEAGANLANTIETNSAFIHLSLTTRRKYKITLRRQDINWHNNLDFFVRRTGNGTGISGGNISGGTNYLLLNTFEQDFFKGRFSRTGIPMQYKIEGIDMTIPSGEYSTYVVYTITSN